MKSRYLLYFKNSKKRADYIERVQFVLEAFEQVDPVEKRPENVILLVLSVDSFCECLLTPDPEPLYAKGNCSAFGRFLLTFTVS